MNFIDVAIVYVIKENKQRLKEYQKNYRKAKKSI